MYRLRRALFNVVTSSMSEMIFNMIRNNEVEQFKSFIAKHPEYDLNAPIDGRPPAILAVNYGANEISRILIEAKTPTGQSRVDLNRACENNLGTPIFHAIVQKNLAAFQLLIDAKDTNGTFIIDLNAVLQYEELNLTPLDLAISRHEHTMVSLLVEARNKDNIHRVDLSKKKSLRLTLHSGDVGLLRLLLAARFDDGQLRVDINQSKTPILTCILYDYADMLEELLSVRKPDGILAVDFDKQLRQGLPNQESLHIFIPNLLLAYAQSNTSSNCKALRYLASFKTDDGDFVLDFHAEDVNDRQTIALRLVQTNDLQSMKILATILGGELNKANSLGIRPLDLALSKGHAEIVEFLEHHLAEYASVALEQQLTPSSSNSP